MQTPTPAQLRTAIEVLARLGERLNTEAAHSAVQLPETQLGAYYARSIEARAIEQITRIKNVTAQLQNWRDELLEQRSVARPAGAQPPKTFEDLNNGVQDQWCDPRHDSKIPLTM